LDRLAAGFFGFGIRAFFQGVPWHNFEEQMLIKQRYEAKEKWLRESPQGKRSVAITLREAMRL
jgi:hypothetical protein